MNTQECPEIKIRKNQIPIIYLDSCILIELAKYAQGKSNSPYRQEIGKLYYMLLTLMQQKRILCPSGNQLSEMGVSKGREAAKNFLFYFTNSKLCAPALVEDAQMDIGYQAFCAEKQIVPIDCGLVLDEKPPSPLPIRVHVSPIYSKEQLEELKQEKLKGVTILNQMKESGSISTNYDQQLKSELESDFYYFLRSLENYHTSFEAYVRCLDQLSAVYKRTGLYIEDLSDPRILPAVDKHNRFLLSNYHHKLPYKWIEAVLWTHRMQRPNKIVQGDNLDTVWAAAYLPFIDYVATDNAFCALLQSSGLAQTYGVKTYSFKTIDVLVNDLTTLLEEG